MTMCSQPKCQTTAGCKCVPLAGTGAILPYMAHLMDDARETLQMRDKRIAELEALVREWWTYGMRMTGRRVDDPATRTYSELSLLGRTEQAVRPIWKD